MFETVAITFWVGVALVLFTVLVVIIAFVVWANEQGQSAPIETGVRIWEGSPGSGKSYQVVHESLRRIEAERRPLYTNLPLKLRTIRAYLRIRGLTGVERYAIRLTKDHFGRFVDRFAQLADYADQREMEGVSRSRALIEFKGEFGPDVPYAASREEWVRHRLLGMSEVEREAARELALEEFEVLPKREGRLVPNWIPYGSMIVIDEVHRWYSQAAQKNESPALLSYLSMHRHGLYFIELISQNAMQMSLSFRRQCVKYFLCVDKRQLGFIWGTFVRLPTFVYQEISAEAAKGDASARFKDQPLRTWVVFPWLNGGLIWRFYQSHTHCGSTRRLKQQLERTREFVEGDEYVPGYEQKRHDMIRKRTSAVWSVVRAGGFVVLTLVCCWWITSTMASNDTVREAIDDAMPGGKARADRDGQAERVSLPRREAVVSGVSPNGAVIDGSMVPVGGRFGDHVLVGMRLDPVGLVFKRDEGDYVVCSVPGRLWIGEPGLRSDLAGRATTQPASRDATRGRSPGDAVAGGGT